MSKPDEPCAPTTCTAVPARPPKPRFKYPREGTDAETVRIAVYLPARTESILRTHCARERKRMSDYVAEATLEKLWRDDARDD